MATAHTKELCAYGIYFGLCKKYEVNCKKDGKILLCINVVHIANLVTCIQYIYIYICSVIKQTLL